MNFVTTTCAVCGVPCTDHLLVNRDGPGLGPAVAVCEACAPCGRPLEELWAAIRDRETPKQLRPAADDWHIFYEEPKQP